MEKYKLVLCGNISWSSRGIIERVRKNEFGRDILITGYIGREDGLIFIISLHFLSIPLFLKVWLAGS